MKEYIQIRWMQFACPECHGALENLYVDDMSGMVCDNERCKYFDIVWLAPRFEAVEAPENIAEILKTKSYRCKK